MRCRVALLGCGEAGSAIGRDLVAAGADVRGYDPRVAPPAGVQVRDDESDAVRDADLVLSVNSGHDAMTALHHGLPGLPRGALWADLNTASPRAKAALAEAAPGVDVVDVAIMAPVPGRGLRTPMVVSGPAAERFARMLGGLGGDVTTLDGPVGAASSRKLLRSVFYKGLAAAVIEALDGAEAAGCRDWLYDNIRGELAGFDETTIERLVTGTHIHARRRLDEMTASADQLQDLGVPPRVAGAARDLLAELLARAGAPE
jgi:3-hydroxyisobutyrate dehydrogenase-like beta-hydroxyacid dehydrogenase